MDEHVYAVPDLTTDVRYGPRERGEREERIVDIYVSADDLNLGTQLQKTAQQQRGASEESKNNAFRAAAVCLGVLCVILLAVIIGLVKHNSECPEEKNNLLKVLIHLQSRYDNVTAQKVQIQSKYNNQTKVLVHLQSRYDNVTAERDELKRRLCESYGWQMIGRGCYYISTEWKTWQQSRQFCRAKQSDLMVINSKEKQDFIKTYQEVWLGLTDIEEEGVWKWIDGNGTTLTTPTHWSPGEPDNAREQDCAASSYGFWYDRQCSYGSRWICERVI